MCLNPDLLRKIVKYSSIVFFLTGCACIAGAIYNFATGDRLWHKKIIDWGYILNWLFVSVGGAAFISGLCGMIGTYKKSKCCLCLYQVTMLIILIVCLICGVGTIVLQDKYLKQMDKQVTPGGGCLQSKLSGDLIWISYVNSNVTLISQYFGYDVGGLGCLAQVNEYELNISKSLQKLNYTNPSNGSIRIQQCTQLDDEFSDFHMWFDLMKFLEEEKQCSGMCNSPGYYMFSDINNTPQNPLKPCYQPLYQLLEGYSQVILIISWIASSIIFLCVLMTFCLCCQHKRGGGGVYLRMSYLDDE